MYKVMTAITGRHWPLSSQDCGPLASYTGTVALTALIVNLKTAVNTVASLNVSIGLAESEREVTRLVSVPNRQLICRLQAAEWAGWLSDYMQGFTMINGAIVKTLLRIL